MRVPRIGWRNTSLRARRSDGAFVQLAINTSSNSLVTVTFVERGRDFDGAAVQRLLVSQRLFGEHPYLLKMQVGMLTGSRVAVHQASLRRISFRRVA